MTKVKTNVAIGEAEPGDVVDLSDDEAAQLVRQGYAEEVAQQRKAVENLNPDKENK